MTGLSNLGLALLSAPARVSNSTSAPTQPSSQSTPSVNSPTSNVYLSFYGEDLVGGGNVQRFQAMVGDNKPPTITGGYAKWNVVDRPLMRSVTIFAGYEPATMTVDLTFGQWGPQWDTVDSNGQTETDIAALDMMAGSASHYISGPPQIVYVAAYSNQGGMSDLIPHKYQYTPYSGSKLFPWVINGLKWGTSYRNPNSGRRVYQEATINLMQYLAPYGAPQAPAAPTHKKGGWFIAKPGRNTALLIAGSPSSMSPNEDHKILAQRIVHANGPYQGAVNPKLGLRSINQPIKANSPVWVPSHVLY